MKLHARPLILLLATFFLLGNVAACFDDDDDDGGEVVQPFTVDLSMNSTNAAAVEGIEFVFDDLSSLDSRFTGQTTVTFTGSSTMRIEGGGTVVEGPVTFGSNSCTVEGVTGSPCELTITTTEPIEANSYVSGSPLAQREDARGGLATAAGDLLRLTPKPLHAQSINAEFFLTLGGNISGVHGAFAGINGGTLFINNNATTGTLTGSGTVTGGTGSGG